MFLRGRYFSGVSLELSKLNKMKEEELRLKERELEIRQFEKYSDEELLAKYNNTDGNREIKNTLVISGGAGNKTLSKSSSTSLVSESKEYRDMVYELYRRMLI